LKFEASQKIRNDELRRYLKRRKISHIYDIYRLLLGLSTEGCDLCIIIDYYSFPRFSLRLAMVIISHCPFSL